MIFIDVVTLKEWICKAKQSVQRTQSPKHVHFQGVNFGLAVRPWTSLFCVLD